MFDDPMINDTMITWSRQTQLHFR